ncbi:MAG: hypothetical protein GX444_08305 [Myxococcales bacterium]|nr:hypothetical protein [Myxococcales bacterium]
MTTDSFLPKKIALPTSEIAFLIEVLTAMVNSEALDQTVKSKAQGLLSVLKISLFTRSGEGN